MRRLLPRLSALGLFLSLLVASCDGGAGPDATLILAIFSGDQQQAVVGEPVPEAPAVKVTDDGGEGVEGVEVTFTVADGGGSVTGSTTTTNGDGVATVGSWTLGTVAGTNTLRASAAEAEGSPVTFTATALAGAAADVSEESGQNQTGEVGQPVPVAPAVEVTDEFGNPVSGVEVTFTVTSGGGSVTGTGGSGSGGSGSVTSTTETTGSDGVATVGSWTLGTSPGENTLEATVEGLAGSSVTFTATANAGPPAQMTKTAGDEQGARVGQQVAVAPTVRLTDEFDNPVSGVGVEFAVTGGGGSVTGASQTTDADGVAAVGSWTLGSAPGENTLEATADGDGIDGNPATFTATGSAADPAAIAVAEGDDQMAQVGQEVDVQPAVLVTDDGGEPAPGVEVTFAVTGGGGSVTGASQFTGSDGIARVGSWTMGTATGENTLEATATEPGTAVAGPAGVIDGNPVTFTATATAGPPAELTKTAGDDQTATAGEEVPVPPAVRVADEFDNPVAGVDVTFAVTGGGGSVTGASQTTGADGMATVGSWTLGSTPGENTLDATAAGDGITGNPATFTATGTEPQPANIEPAAGEDQVQVAGEVVPVAPAVLVTDADDNPVPGVEVTFAVTGGGGSVTGATQTTGADGMATVGSWELGPEVGENTLEATASESSSPAAGPAAVIAGNPVTFTATGALDPAAMPGTWTGMWNNTTFGSSGGVELVITVDQGAQTATLTLDVDGSVFGGSDPPPVTKTGSYSAAGFELMASLFTSGDGDLSVSPTGEVTYTVTNPGPGIARIEYTGTLTTTEINLEWTLTFTGGGTAVGDVTLTKQ